MTVQEHQQPDDERQSLCGSGFSSRQGSYSQNQADDHFHLCPDMGGSPTSITVGALGQYYGVRRFHLALLLISLILKSPAACLQVGLPYLMREIQTEFGVSGGAASFIASSVLMGSTLGVIIGGPLSDRFGRRACLIAFALVGTSANLLHLAIPAKSGLAGFAWLIMLRSFLGLPYGGIITVARPYLSEFLADHVRGTFLTVSEFAWMLSSVYAITCIQVYHGSLGWRVILSILPVIPALLALSGLAYLPESPRWLFICGQKEKGQRALDEIFASQAVYGVAIVGQAPPVVVPASQDLGMGQSQSSIWMDVKSLFGPGLRKITVLCCILYAIMAGVTNTIWLWGPSIVELLIKGTVNLEMFKISESAAIPAILVTMLGIDVIGRKPFILLGFGLLTAVISSFNLMPWTQERILVAWLCLQFAGNILWATLSVYLTEAFPTFVRGTGCGFCFFFGRITSVLFPMIAGEMLERQMLDALLWKFAIMSGIAFLTTMLFLKEMAQCRTQDACSGCEEAVID